MDVRIASFTDTGFALALTVAQFLEAAGDSVQTTRISTHSDVTCSRWCSSAFLEADALVFIGAVGIAVRTIAPFVRDKSCDPAVVCIDERANWCVPLLSGHIGGANELARRLSSHLGSHACVTTATDVNGLWAVDEWATSQGLVICDVADVKTVSSKLLAKGCITFASEFPIDGSVPSGIDVVDPTRPVDVYVGPHTADAVLRLVPRCVVVGVGCKAGASSNAVDAAVTRALREADLHPASLKTLASIDIKAHEEGLLEFARSHDMDFVTFSADELMATEGTFSSSEFVRTVTGADNVCERACVACGAQLVLTKHAYEGVTVALGVTVPELSFERGRACGTLSVVGLGPGDPDHMTPQARRAIAMCDVVVGYKTYIDLVSDLTAGKTVVESGMRREVERCETALELARAGHDVALICSGDAVVYGMASPLLELAADYPDVHVTVVSGVTAATSGAALLGAPLGHDFCVISLSDLLTPWEVIERRLEAAAETDMCICLYNPASKGRRDHLRRACDVVLRHRDGLCTCGVTKNIGRKDETSFTCSLGELRECVLDMHCTVFIGNSQTHLVLDRMVTPRGYHALGDVR